MKKIDVVLNVYGKPYQTAVTLLSLLKFSGDLIDKIYFIEEPKQPKGTDFTFLYRLLKDRLVRFRPKHWLWVNQTDKSRLQDLDYRLSIRYQYGWEKSDKDFIFLTHNDVLYTGNIIQVLLDNIKDHLAIGSVGQCWNCPASAAKLCKGSHYWEYRPSVDQLTQLLEKHQSKLPRKFDEKMNYAKILKTNEAWPLPECRLNEWVALIDLKKAREITIPNGDAMPFGSYYGLDLGTQWFYDVSRLGYKIMDYNFNSIANHGWASESANGHSALFNKQVYKCSESVAKDVLINEFNLTPEDLSNPKIFSISSILNYFKKRTK